MQYLSIHWNSAHAGVVADAIASAGEATTAQSTGLYSFLIQVANLLVDLITIASEPHRQFLVCPGSSETAVSLPHQSLGISRRLEVCLRAGAAVKVSGAVTHAGFEFVRSERPQVWLRVALTNCLPGIYSRIHGVMGYRTGPLRAPQARC